MSVKSQARSPDGTTVQKPHDDSHPYNGLQEKAKYTTEEMTVPPNLYLRNDYSHANVYDARVSASSVSPDTPSSMSTLSSVVPFVSGTQGVNQLPISSPKLEKFSLRMASAFFMFFTCGWGDGVTGTVLPYFKEDYNLSYMISSLLFITSTVGFAIGVLLFEHIYTLMGRNRQRQPESKQPTSGFLAQIQDYLPRTTLTQKRIYSHSPSLARFRILIIASILHAGFFVIMGTSVSFANVLCGFSISAFSRAFLTGTANAYIASTPKRPLGLLHACWAGGAFVAPFVCQTLLAKGIPWEHFYLGSLALSVINTTFLVIAFHPTRNEFENEGHLSSPLVQPCIESQLEVNPVISEKGRSMDRTNTILSEKTSGSSVSSPSGSGKRDSLRYALSLGYTWAFCFFVWVYSGSETTTQSYMVTYLLNVRNADPKTVGYVSSGFWAGMAISRAITGVVSPHLSFNQRKHAIHVLIGIQNLFRHIMEQAVLIKLSIAIGLSMYLLIWFVKSVFENAFSTAIIGLVYGPIFPSVLALATDILPREVHMVAMTVISGFANLGGSTFPFLTGAMSNLRGPHVLVYVTVAQTGTLILFWFFFPSRPKLHA